MTTGEYHRTETSKVAPWVAGKADASPTQAYYIVETLNLGANLGAAPMVLARAPRAGLIAPDRVSLDSSSVTHASMNAPMTWWSSSVNGTIVELFADDALIRGRQIPITKPLSALELDEVAHAFGNIEVGMLRNIDSGSHNVVFGVSSNRINSSAIRGQQLIFHTHPSGSLIPSAFDIDAL
jgi:hypothetical protein